MNNQIFMFLILGSVSALTLWGFGYMQSVSACGKCWNVTAGEPLEVIGIDLTGDDAGYAIKMDCTVDEKPDPPGSPLHLTCTEEPIGNYSRTG